MTDPGVAFQTAAVTAIRSALTAQSYTNVSKRVVVDPKHGEAFPYVVVGNDTAITFPTKTSEGTELTHTFVCWATTMLEAKNVASYVLDALTDRDAPLTVTGYTLAGCDLDFRGPPLRDEQPTQTYWGVPVRVRYRLIQT